MSEPESSRQPGQADTASIDRRLLEILVCPLTKSTLDYDHSKQELISRKAGLAYPIRNGVPLMTAEAARTLDDDEMSRR